MLLRMGRCFEAAALRKSRLAAGGDSPAGFIIEGRAAKVTAQKIKLKQKTKTDKTQQQHNFGEAASRRLLRKGSSVFISLTVFNRIPPPRRLKTRSPIGHRPLLDRTPPPLNIPLTLFNRKPPPFQLDKSLFNLTHAPLNISLSLSSSGHLPLAA